MNTVFIPVEVLIERILVAQDLDYLHLSSSGLELSQMHSYIFLIFKHDS